MKIAILFSGGKDSTAATFELSKSHEIACLISIKSKNPHSFMFHTPNISLTELQARSMEIPLIEYNTRGEKEKELFDLEEAIKIAKERYNIKGIGVGAIESEYQRKRVEEICKKLKLKMLAPFWKKDVEKYLKYLLANNFKLIFTAVAAEGLDESWIGKRLNEEVIEKLKELNKKYQIHLAGEGGEYETFVLDCPLFKKRLKILKARKVWEKNSGRFVIDDLKLVEKNCKS